MTYAGGKNGHGTVQTLINLIPPHDEYIAPFAGFDAVARLKRPARRNVLIDLDRVALERLWDAIGVTTRGFEFHLADGIGWLRSRFNLDRIDQRPSPRRSPATPWTAAAATDQTFVLVDPPYRLATRTKRLYRHELEEAGHVRLLETVIDLPCPCLVCCYAADIVYETTLSARGWQRVDYWNATRGGPRKESAWMNYPSPVVLHDSSFVGANKRQRERIRRRARNFAAALKRLPVLERQAILDLASELSAKEG